MEINTFSEEYLENATIGTIKKGVGGKNPVNAIEKEFVRRITLCEQSDKRDKAREYFLGDFSTPILTYTTVYLYNKPKTKEILSDYYEFISKENKQIPYYKLKLYANINNSTLRHYVTTITIRHFVDKKKKDDNNNRGKISIDGATTIKNDEENGKDVIENPWFNLLINNNGEDKENTLRAESYKKIDLVFSKLPERDVKTIKLMVMDGVSGLEAFEEMKDDIEKTAKSPVATWSTKKIQDAMALQKARALKHFLKIVKDEKIDF